MSRPATSKPKCNPIQGELPVLQYCPVEQLTVDESYQRSLEGQESVTLIRRIATYWDWGLCQPLYVSRRSDGGLYVVDGQHRLAAAKLRGDIWQLPCVVRAFDSAEAEAAAFVALNQERRPLNKLQIFKAALAAGDFEAGQILACVTEAGLSIASSTNLATCAPGAVSNIPGLQNCYRVHGVQVLTAALRVLAQAYPRQVLRYAGTIFPGIVAIVAAEPGSDRLERMARMVGSRAQQDWVRDVQALLAADPTMPRKRAAAQAFEAAWSDRRDGASNRETPPGAAPGPERQYAPTAAPARTFLKPAEMAWCDQCDQRVSGARAEACTSKFCSLKERLAA